MTQDEWHNFVAQIVEILTRGMHEMVDEQYSDADPEGVLVLVGLSVTLDAGREMLQKESEKALVAQARRVGNC